jgi:hypothetical protein
LWFVAHSQRDKQPREKPYRGPLRRMGGSSNPFRGTPLGPVRCVSFELWMMGLPTAWRQSMPPATPSSRKSRKSS